MIHTGTIFVNNNSFVITLMRGLWSLYRYDGTDPVATFPKELGPYHEDANRATDTEYCYGTIQRTMWILFPGTESVRDVLTDVMFWKKEVPYFKTNPAIRVHAGFLHAYQSVRSKIHQYTRQIDPASFIVAGHSLGAGLASLCAVDLQYNFRRAVTLHTSGSPRVGNAEFARSATKRVVHFRRITKKDIVTLLPIWGYRHFGNAVTVPTCGHRIHHYIRGMEKQEEWAWKRFGGG